VKKFLLLVTLSVFVLSGCVSTTLAQTASSSASPARTTFLDQRAASRAAEKRENRVNKAQDRLASFREKVASRTAQLKLHLQNFRDQKKAQVVEKVNDRMSKINETRTENMLKKLTKMTEIVTKLESRVNSVVDKDTTAAKSAITQAKSDIASASAAVNAQAEVDYPIEATEEAVIKDEVVGQRLNLHSDLRAAHQAVVNARKSVTNAIKTVAQTLGGVKNGQQ
jgi:TolA-binding protein